jgi:rhodanese-related sulfurtransferase
MKKSLLLLGSISLLLAKENPVALQYTGVFVHLEQNRTIKVERVQERKCLDIAISPENIFGKEKIDQFKRCIRKVFTTLGTVQPMQIAPGIKTVGEIELLSFLKKKEKSPSQYILIDSRKEIWYKKLTIPSSVNIPYNEIAYDPDFPEEHQRLLKLLKIQKTKDGYDFSNAKSVLLFCNGAWCEQSPRAIRILLEMGYPKAKILWYRGGLQDWLLMGFRGVKP